MILHTILWIFAAGFVLLALGGEAVIRGGVMLKRALGFSPVIIGFFVLSLGTSSSTLAVAIQASASDASDLVVGAVIGTTLINLLLILGLGALIQPMPSPPKVVLRDGGALILGGAALVLLALRGTIDRGAGAILLGLFLIYAGAAIVSDWRRSPEHSVACAEAEKRLTGEHPSIGGGLFVLVIGILCLLIGAHFLTGSALSLAAVLNLPLGAVAATLVAAALCLPVFVVTMIAALRGHTQIAVGHLIAASVFNLLAVLGIAALVRPVHIAASFARVDVFAVLGAGVLLLLLLSTSWRLSRPKALLLLVAYAGYAAWLAWQQGLLPHALLGLS